MNVKRAELIQSLQNVKKSLHEDDSSLMEASEVVEKLRSSVPKSGDKSSVASDIKEQFQKALGEGVSVEKEWKPQKTSIKNIMDRVLVEATYEQQNNPNAMRLNLQSMVLDKTHAKFSINRNGVDALVELLYPNVNDKITIKVSVKNADDNLVEVGLEDQPYLTDLGAYILKLVDETIMGGMQNMAGIDSTKNQTTMYLGNKSGGMTGYPPTWEQGGETSGVTMWESDGHKISSLMALVEQEEDEEDLEADVGGVDEFAGLEGGEDAGTDAGFTEEDFAIDAGAPVDTGDFTADFGGDFGGGEGAGDVNAADEGTMVGDAEPDAEWSTFRDKTDWLQSSLDTMQNLTSNSIAQKMQQGTGVVLTSDEILNGTVGLRNDMPIDVIDKFLNVYPELDNIELKESDLDLIEQKLSLDDGQFDAWLQQKLPEFTGQDEVSATLDNEMFEEFEPMGGETEAELDQMDREAEATPEASFEDFMDSVSEEDTTTPEEIEAESEVDIPELPELPNI